MKIDNSGDNLEFVKSYSTSNGAGINDIERTSDGYLLAGGKTESGGIYSDALILNVNETGVKQWAGLIAEQWDQHATDIQLTPEGDSIALVYGSWVSEGSSSSDTLAARITKQGGMGTCCSLMFNDTANITEGNPAGYSVTTFTTIPTQENLFPTGSSGGYSIKNLDLPVDFICPTP